MTTEINPQPAICQLCNAPVRWLLFSGIRLLGCARPSCANHPDIDRVLAETSARHEEQS